MCVYSGFSEGTMLVALAPFTNGVIGNEIGANVKMLPMITLRSPEHTATVQVSRDFERSRIAQKLNPF